MLISRKRCKSSVQPGFTKEEFITEMTKIKTAMEENLSDEDLAKSAGGADAGKIALTVSVVSCHLFYGWKTALRL